MNVGILNVLYENVLTYGHCDNSGIVSKIPCRLHVKYGVSPFHTGDGPKERVTANYVENKIKINDETCRQGPTRKQKEK